MQQASAAAPLCALTEHSPASSVQGQRIALSSGGTFLYLGNDVLGSPTAALTASGTLYGAHLYGPYGTVRYSTGSWPAAGGYTGQWSDRPSGLNYFVARYYDTGVGDFVSADPVNAGLDRYAYVSDNPETLTDPSGHCGMMTNTPGNPECGSGSSGGGDSGNSNNGNNNNNNTATCTGDNCRDKNGKCANWATCDKDRAAAGQKLYEQGNKDKSLGELIVLAANGLQFILAVMAKDWYEVLDKGINLLVAILSYGVDVANFLFGPDSGAAQFMRNMMPTLNTALITLRGVMAAVHGVLGLVKWFAGSLGYAEDLLMGPAGLIMDAASHLGQAVLNGGTAAGMYLISKGDSELDQLADMGRQTDPQWCNSNPGTCGIQLP